MVISVVDPKSIGILTTMKCTAACQDAVLSVRQIEKKESPLLKSKKLLIL